MRSWPGLVAAALLVFAGPAATAGVDVESAPNLKVKSSLADAEVESFAFAGEAGGLLSLTVKASPKSAPGFEFEVELFDDDTETQIPVPIQYVRDLGSKLSWKKFPLPASANYALRVRGQGPGEYSLTMKLAPQKKFTGTLEFVGAPTLDFPFAVPAGSSVKAVVRAAPGSMAKPEFQSLFGPSAYNDDISADGTKTATGHTVELAPLSNGGDYTLRVANLASPGFISVLVIVKPPKRKPVRLDLRDAVLGRPYGGATFLARTVDADGGLVEVADASSDLDRAAVSVPVGAVSGEILLSIGSAEVPPLGAVNDQAAGPAVDLGPSGTVFQSPVTVTLPFDFTKIPAGSTPADILIRIVEDNGSFVEVAPDSVDELGGTVSVQALGFSVCIPVIQSGPPSLGLDSRGQVKPGGDEYWLMQMTAEYYPDAGGDSRQRRIGTAFGTFSFHSDNSFEFASLEHSFQWLNSDGSGGQPIDANPSESNDPTSGNLTWAYDASGRRILLSGGAEELPTFRISRDGRTIAGRREGSVEPYAETIFGIRKHDGPMELDSVRGAWNGVYLELSADFTPSTGAAEPVLLRGLATVTFDGVGGARLSISERETEFNAANGSFAQPLGSVTVDGLTYSIDEDGTVLLTIPPFDAEDEGTTLRFFPGQGLEVMFGGHDQVLGNGAFAIVLMRQGSGQSKADLSGFYHGGAFSADPVSYTTSGGNGVRIADLNARSEGTLAAFDGGSTATLTFEPREVQRNETAPFGLEVGNGTETFDLSVSVASTGKVALGPASSGGVGAARQDGGLVVVTSSLANAGGDYGLIFFFLAPPDQSAP